MTRLATALADRYRIERERGQGGMATVYLAQDLKHDRKVKGPAQNNSTYLRVIPDWVRQMRAAVDAAAP